MNLRTTLTVLLASALVTASVAMADESSGTAPAKPAPTTAATKHSSTHHMKLTKDQVSALQNALVKTGDYKGKVDGTLGKETEDALRAYQKTNGLKVTGYPDTATLDKLGLPHAATTTASTAGTPTKK